MQNGGFVNKIQVVRLSVAKIHRHVFENPGSIHYFLPPVLNNLVFNSQLFWLLYVNISSCPDAMQMRIEFFCTLLGYHALVSATNSGNIFLNS